MTKLDKMDDAVVAFEHCVSIDPQYTKAWKNLALILDDLGKHEEALKAYKQVLKTNPNPT